MSPFWISMGLWCRTQWFRNPCFIHYSSLTAHVIVLWNSFLILNILYFPCHFLFLFSQFICGMEQSLRSLTWGIQGRIIILISNVMKEDSTRWQNLLHSVWMVFDECTSEHCSTSHWALFLLWPAKVSPKTDTGSGSCNSNHEKTFVLPHSRASHADLGWQRHFRVREAVNWQMMWSITVVWEWVHAGDVKLIFPSIDVHIKTLLNIWNHDVFKPVLKFI